MGASLRMQTSKVTLLHDDLPWNLPDLAGKRTRVYGRWTWERSLTSTWNHGVVGVTDISRAVAQRLGVPFLGATGLTVSQPVAPVPVNVGGEYVLTVGTLEPRKNISALIAAFESFVADGGRPRQLVIVGRRGWQSPPARSTFVRVLGHVSDPELWWLYQNATLFICPSLYEGFGIPVLEAYTAGVIVCVAVSRVPSAGLIYAGDPDAIINIEDPEDVTQLVRALREGVGKTRKGPNVVAPARPSRVAQAFINIVKPWL